MPFSYRCKPVRFVWNTLQTNLNTGNPCNMCCTLRGGGGGGGGGGKGVVFETMSNENASTA